MKSLWLKTDKLELGKLIYSRKIYEKDNSVLNIVDNPPVNLTEKRIKINLVSLLTR